MTVRRGERGLSGMGGRLLEDGNLHPERVACGRGNEPRQSTACDKDRQRILLCHRAPAHRNLPLRAPPRAQIVFANEHPAQGLCVSGGLLETRADTMRALLALGLPLRRFRLREHNLDVLRHVHLVVRVAAALSEPRELRHILLELPEQRGWPEGRGLLPSYHPWR
jgi:hypothetical protein